MENLFDSDDDIPPRPKKEAPITKKRKSTAPSSDEEMLDDVKLPAKKVPKPTRESTTKTKSGKPPTATEPKAKPKPKPVAKKNKKADDDFIVPDEDEDDAGPSTSKKADTEKVLPKKPKWAIEMLIFVPSKYVDVMLYSWAAIQAAKAAGPLAPGSKIIPNGQPNCLAGLCFVFTGELTSFSREEAVDLAKRYGGFVFPW